MEVQQSICPSIQQIKNTIMDSQPILLSSIINFKLNSPRENERTFHHINVQQAANSFNINQWDQVCPKSQLYHISLIGHIIQVLHLLGGTASAQTLIELTEPFLPYLRKLNGKSFSGDANKTVKGCLSAVVFIKDSNNNCSLNIGKVDEFVYHANVKLQVYMEKLQRLLPIFERRQQKKLIIKDKKRRQKLKALIVKTKQEFEVKEEKVEKLELKIEYEKCCVGWSNELKEKVGELMNSGCKSKIEMDSGREILEYMQKEIMTDWLLGYLIVYEMLFEQRYDVQFEIN